MPSLLPQDTPAWYKLHGTYCFTCPRKHTGKGRKLKLFLTAVTTGDIGLRLSTPGKQADPISTLHFR